MSERWLPIPGWEDIYEVSDLGNIRSLPREIEQLDRWGNPCVRKLRGKVLKFYHADAGDAYVKVRGNGRIEKLSVARTVATVFLGSVSSGHNARHRGAIADNRVENIFWATPPKWERPKKTALGLTPRQKDILACYGVCSLRSTSKIYEVHKSVVKRLWDKYAKHGAPA